MKFSLLPLCALLLGLAACGGDAPDAQLADLQSENERLKQRIQEDSLFAAEWSNQMLRVDSILANALNTAETEAAALEATPEERARLVDSLMRSAQDRISELESKLRRAQQSSSGYRNNPVLVQNLADKKAKIAEYEAIIEEQRQRIEELEVETASQSRQIAGLDRELDKTRDESQEARAEALRQRQAAEEAREEKEKRINDNLMRGAYSSLERARALPTGLLTKPKVKKQRQALLEDAYNNFCKAHKRGVNRALTEMNAMKREFEKELQGMSC